MEDLSNYELKELMAMIGEINRTHQAYSHVTDKCVNFNYDLKKFTDRIAAEYIDRETKETI